MKIVAILVDEKPKTYDDCPFHTGDWEHYCVLGGECGLRYRGFCTRLTAPFEAGTVEQDSWFDEED